MSFHDKYLVVAFPERVIPYLLIIIILHYTRASSSFVLICSRKPSIPRCRLKSPRIILCQTVQSKSSRRALSEPVLAESSASFILFIRAHHINLVLFSCLLFYLLFCAEKVSDLYASIHITA